MADKKKYSYIRYPHSSACILSLVLGTATLLITAVVAVRAVLTGGETGEILAAAGVCAMLLSLTGVVFALLGLREAEHNHLLGWIGGGCSLLVLCAWLLTVFL